MIIIHKCILIKIFLFVAVVNIKINVLFWVANFLHGRLYGFPSSTVQKKDGTSPVTTTSGEGVVYTYGNDICVYIASVQANL